MEGLTAETNTAARIFKPEHSFLENTISSMEAAFAAGADIVEFDLHPTKDGQFAVFHDWTLEYRTEGKGVTREHTLAELKALDVGYGYTADQSQTFPFRGKGKGLMPSLDEVLQRFPDKSFLIHVKSNDPLEGNQLAAFLGKLPKAQLNQIWVYGGDRPIACLQQQLSSVRALSKATMKQALIPYVLLGWTGYVPVALKNSLCFLPLRYARFMWGWPHVFLKRLADAGTPFVVIAGDGPWSSGFDTAEDLKELPENFTGGVWTNRIDRIAPLIKGK